MACVEQTQHSLTTCHITALKTSALLNDFLTRRAPLLVCGFRSSAQLSSYRFPRLKQTRHSFSFPSPSNSDWQNHNSIIGWVSIAAHHFSTDTTNSLSLTFFANAAFHIVRSHVNDFRGTNCLISYLARCISEGLVSLFSGRAILRYLL